MRSTEIFELAWATVCPAVFGIMLSYLIGMFVFGPIHARAFLKPPQTSYRIADVIILLLQLQLAGGVLFALFEFFERGSDAERLGIPLVVWLLLTFWWWTGVRMLARAKVHYSPHRWLFLGVFVPLGYAATIGLLLLPLTTIISLAAILAMVMALASTSGDALSLAGLLALNAATIAAVVATRAFCRRIVRRAKDDVAAGDGVALGQLVEAEKPLFVREHAPMASDREVKFFDDPPSSEPVA